MENVIKNFEALARNATRLDALSIAEAGYEAIDVGETIAHKLRVDGETLRIGDAKYQIGGRRIYFVGVGKCAIAAATAIEKLLDDRLTGGIALDVSSIDRHNLTIVEAYIGTHPLPSSVNERATKRILDLLSGCGKEDLVIMLVSGGGSTLLCLPEEPMTYLDEKLLFTELTKRGATIQEVNTVRKHTSHARGGALAQAAFPAEVISLIVSDVPGNVIEYIASGPTVLDTTTIDDVHAILTRYEVTPSERAIFLETPKDPKYFERVNNVLLITNQDALRAMQREAVRRGYDTTIVSDHLSGEASDIGRSIAETLHIASPKTALLYAGESTVTLPAYAGMGGRNQEMSLATLRGLHDDELILPFSSDGRDNTEHAGAIADAVTRAHAEMRGLSIDRYLADHRSYDFFTDTGDAVLTGYTGSNVSDLIIAIKN